jgi:glutamyl-tRNA reductase
VKSWGAGRTFKRAQERLIMTPSPTAVPLLVALRERGAAIQATEMEKARRRLGKLRPDQEQALEALGSAIVDRLLHAPTVAIEEMASEGEVEDNARLLRAVLGIA